jgi:hypothetical protein
VPLPSTRRPGYPEDLERIVMRGLERQPEKRWWTARELQVELETFARQRQLAMSPVTLARLMEELFPDDLHAWQAAQSRGTALADHVTKSHTLSIDAPGDATTEPWVGGAADAPRSAEAVDGSAPARARSRRVLVAAAVALATAASLAAVLVARHGSGPVPAEAPRATTTPLTADVAPHATTPPPTVALPTAAEAATAAAPTGAAPTPSSAAAPTPSSTVARPPARRHPVRVAKKPAHSPAATRWDPEAAVLPH